MTQVTVLHQGEGPSIDGDLLSALYRTLGPGAAERLVCDAIEQLAVALTLCADLYEAPDHAELARTLGDMTRISEQVGLNGMSLVASHVLNAVNQRDPVALAATMSRLMRVGQASLTAVWDVHDL